MRQVLDEIVAERVRQEDRWGESNHPDTYPHFHYWMAPAERFKEITDGRARAGVCSYTDVLLEEVAEAIDEARAGNKRALREELIQVAAVAVKWVEKIDRGY